jgi:threonine/homoserine/homoserine lactone efflux protein
VPPAEVARVNGVHDLLLFVAAGLLLNLTPGPDMAYIASRSAAGGFRDGAAAVLGITAGCFVHTAAAALGLSALLATSATAFEIVKWCGALYLAYAGVRLIIGGSAPTGTVGVGGSAPTGTVGVGGSADADTVGVAGSAHAGTGTPAPAAPMPAALSAASPARIFREALVINVLNPKVALFFLAFVPQFIAADAPAKPLSFVLLGVLFNFNSLFVNLPVAWAASRAGRRWREGARPLRIMQRATGALFIVLAARLAAVSRS